MGSQMRIGLGVVGVLLILFLVILYSRFGGDQPVLQIPAQAPAVPATDVSSNPASPSQPTIVKDDHSLELPQEAFNPGLPPLPPAPIGPEPGALLPQQLLTPAEYEARRTQRWPVPSPLEDAPATPATEDPRRLLFPALPTAR